jgi:hypothetical protein
MPLLIKVLTIMDRQKIVTLPVLQRLMTELGENTRLAVDFQQK